jgi:predicted nucleic acid-binding protein
MILIDTSVWIEFFRQNVKYTEEIERLLKRKLIISIEPVFSELLFGVRHRKDKEMILSYWRILPKIEFGTTSMLKAAEFASDNNFYQSGIGLMDAIIIKSARDGNHTIWTLDKKINNNIDKKYIYQRNVA